MDYYVTPSKWLIPYFQRQSTITAGCMRPFIPRTNKDEITATTAAGYAANCAPQHTANLPPHSRVVSLSIDNQAIISTICRPGYSRLAPLLHDIHKATTTLLFSCAAVQVGWTTGHSGITGNDLADAAAKLLPKAPPQTTSPGPTHTLARTPTANSSGSGRSGANRKMTSLSLQPQSSLPSSPSLAMPSPSLLFTPLRDNRVSQPSAHLHKGRSGPPREQWAVMWPHSQQQPHIASGLASSKDSTS